MSRLVLVVYSRSRLCFLNENDNRLVFEIATTVNINGIDRERAIKLRSFENTIKPKWSVEKRTEAEPS